MPETKDCQVMVNLEPTIYTATETLTNKLKMSKSSYCRSLIIKDLQARGLLTDTMLVNLLTGN